MADAEAASEDIYEEPRFLCCCQRIHIRTAVVIIAFLEMLCLFIFIPFSITLGIVMLVITVIALSVLFYAIHTNNALLVLPYLVWQGVQSLILLIYFLFVLVTGSLFLADIARTHNEMVKDLTRGRRPGTTLHGDAVAMIQESKRMQSLRIGAFFFLLALIGTFMGLSCWWTFVVYRFYQYLKIHGAAGNAAAKVDVAAAAAEAAKVSGAKRSGSAAPKEGGSAIAKVSASNNVGKEAQD